jgi:hypothetical protein
MSYGLSDEAEMGSLGEPLAPGELMSLKEVPRDEVVRSGALGEKPS